MVRRMLDLESGIGRSHCYARLQWFEGMALCVLARSLTRIAHNRLLSAKGYLARVNDARDLIPLNMDFGFWLLYENEWSDLGAVVDELLDLCIAEHRPEADVETLRLWKLGIEKGVVDQALTAEVFRRLRGVRKLDGLVSSGRGPKAGNHDGRSRPYGW